MCNNYVINFQSQFYLPLLPFVFLQPSITIYPHPLLQQPSYGVKNSGCELSAIDVEKIVLSRFNEKDILQHMTKVLFGCGLYAAFRGSKEHTYFSKSQVSFGKYPENYECQDLAGHPYVAIDNFPDDKTNKISISNSYTREMNNNLRFPIVPEDPSNFGGSLARLIKKMAPGQTRVYCKPAQDPHLRSLMAQGFPDACFYYNKPLGEKTISKLFKDGGKFLGISPNFRPHSLRGACITMLVNDSSVSTAEQMAVSRHASVSAAKGYQRVDGISEGNRLRALKMQMPSRNKKIFPEEKKVAAKRKKGDENEEEWGRETDLEGGPPVTMTQMNLANLKGEFEEMKDFIVGGGSPGTC